MSHDTNTTSPELFALLLPKVQSLYRGWTEHALVGGQTKLSVLYLADQFWYLKKVVDEKFEAKLQVVAEVYICTLKTILVILTKKFSYYIF
jgi:hypothetical protein